MNSTANQNLEFVGGCNMLKKNCIYILISAVIMLVLPGLVATFAKPDNSMAILLLMFFLVNPVTAIATGIFAGKQSSFAWFYPLLLAVLFVMGSWIFFDMGEIDFIFYAIVYLLLGYISMMITSFVVKKR